MSDNCKTVFPGYIKHEKVLYVIAKVAGASWHYASFDKNEFDNTLPGSNTNPWHIKFDSKQVKAENTSCIGMINFNFHDGAEQYYSWTYHLELSDRDDEKVLNPGSYGFSVAIAKRLVDFFGGQTQFSDIDEDYPEKHYKNDNPKFPRIIKETEKNERWYTFYNLLEQEPMLTYAELKEACDAYGTSEKDVKLLNYLKNYELYINMEEKINQKYGVKNLNGDTQQNIKNIKI
jgi:hypothetical protein